MKNKHQHRPGFLTPLIKPVSWLGHRLAFLLVQWRLGRATMHVWCWIIRRGNRAFHWGGIKRELRGQPPRKK